MKSFDLEEALSGKTCVTHSGVRVTDLVYFNSLVGLKLFAVVDGSLKAYHDNGQFLGNDDFHEDDLFMLETGSWINLFYDKDRDMPWLGVNRYETEEEAQSNLTDHKWYQTSIKLKL